MNVDPTHVWEVARMGVVALTWGLWRPRILVSSGLIERLDDDALAAVLAHEASHLHRRDPLRLLALRVLAAMAVPFPIVRQLASHAELTIEIHADTCAVRTVGRSPTARALLTMLSNGRQQVDEIAVGAFDGMAARVGMLTEGKMPRFSPSLDALLVSLASAGVAVLAVALLLRALEVTS